MTPSSSLRSLTLGFFFFLAAFFMGGSVSVWGQSNPGTNPHYDGIRLGATGASTSRALTITQTGSGTPTQTTCGSGTGVGHNWNQICVTDTGVDASGYAAGSTNSNSLTVATLSSGGKGTKVSIYGSMKANGAPSAASATNEWLAGQFITLSDAVNLGGTNLGAGASGALFAYGFGVKTSSANLSNTTGAEGNISLVSGASTVRKSILSLASSPDDAVRGTTYDGQLSISDQLGAIGFGALILVSDYNGKQPGYSGTTIIKTQGSNTIAGFADGTSYTYNTTFIKGPGSSEWGKAGQFGIGQAADTGIPLLIATDTSTGIGTRWTSSNHSLPPTTQFFALTNPSVANDAYGSIYYSGFDSTSTQFDAAVIQAVVLDPTHAAPKGQLKLLLDNGGTAFTFDTASGFVSSSAGVGLPGSSSGKITLKSPAAAGSNTITFPAGTTNFSSTGGTSQVVKQTSSGGAFTVARLACADLSDSSTGCSAASGITALTGDVTATGPGSVASTVANLTTGVTVAGTMIHTNIAAPSSPSSGKVTVFADSTDLRLHDKNASGVIGTTVVADTGASNNFLTAISAAGAISKAQPSFSNISGTASATQGGTGLSSFTQGDIIYSSASNTLSALAKNTSSTRYLSNTGTSNNPAWAQVDLSNGVTGTLPIANGGTNDTGTAWTTYTPSLSCGSGTLTSSSASGRYKTLGKTVFIQISATITTNGTCGTNLIASLPVTAGPAASYMLAGRETVIAGKELQGNIPGTTTNVSIINYDNSYPGSSGATLTLSGTFEQG